jgi:hypothetical protein
MDQYNEQVLRLLIASEPGAVRDILPYTMEDWIEIETATA